MEESKYAAAVEDALRLYLDMRGAVCRQNKDICLMDMACIGTKYLKSQGKADNLDESEEINACSIEVPVTVDGKTEQCWCSLRTKPTTTPRRLSPSVARPLAWAAPFVTR